MTLRIRLAIQFSILAFLALLPPDASAAENNSWDIAVIDRALTAAQPDERWIAFGDVGLSREQLRSFRARLVTERKNGPKPDAVTPPGTAFKWPGGNVYYQFDGTVSEVKKQATRDAMAEWAAFANLTFIENIAGQLHYITVQEDPSLGGGFSSAVGRDQVNAEQFVRIGPNAWNRGTLCHEIGHALGLHHEQQRSDRDSFVAILTANIASGQEPNFAKLPAPPGGSTNIGAYDFYSVMHYERNALSGNGQDTIQPLPAYAQFLNVIGRVYDRTLSKLDRAGIAAIYSAPAVVPSAVVTNTNDSGPGSLRSAIYYAFDRSTDAVPLPTSIVFNIGGSPVGGVFTIKPTVELVAPGANTTIDGNSQTLFSGDTNASGPEVVIDGSQIAAQNLGLFGRAFTLREQGCAIKNLVINGFNRQGVAIDGTRAALFGTTASVNTIAGCYIGTDQSGTVGPGNGNGWPGLEIFGGGSNNTIGGLTSANRNVISGSTGHGIVIQGAGSNNNLVVGNYLGTNAAGTGSLANNFTGIAIYGGAQNNTIGGTSAAARNVISGNKLQGILFADAGTNGNTALGNYVGLNAAGTAAVPNGNANFAAKSFYPGVAISNGAQNNVIGGTTAGSANVISGNTAQGIAIVDANTTGNIVRGNFIGTNPAGTAAIGNGFADPPNNYRYAGVDFFGGSQSNVVGGTNSSAANVISGNAGLGIAISGNGTNANLIQGNFIGTNAPGTGAIANGYSGIGIFNGAQSNTIGGTSSGARNLISGNSNQGIALSQVGTNANVIRGNYIGTDASGTAPLANSSEGVAIFGGAQSNIIGGNVPGAGNVISGNLARGVGFFDAATTNNSVQGNLIGLNAAGTGAIPNSFSGVECYLASNNTIGGANPGARNYISGNSDRGVLIDGPAAAGNKIIGNTIGLTRSGIALPNATQGVAMYNGAHGNFIGGVVAGESNVVASNSQEGIALYDASTTANTISRNSIYLNGFIGIGLYTNSNNNQPAPILFSATLSPVGNPNGTDINGSVAGAATVEFFANPSGDDEGRFLVGAFDASGGNFSASLPATVPANYIITATATASGSTSQFSNTVGVNVSDTDSDGIPDNYAALHMLSPSSASLDADGDGMTNFQEFRAGTDPKVASSAFRISAVTRSGIDLALSFASVPGKTYRIESKDDIALANWTLAEDQVLALGASTAITDFGAAGLAKRFYRVLIEP